MERPRRKPLEKALLFRILMEEMISNGALSDRFLTMLSTSERSRRLSLHLKEKTFSIDGSN